MTTRRDFLIGSTVLGLTLPAPAALAAPSESRALIGEFRRIERDVKGRLGVSVLYTGSGRQFGFRALERFPMCSTFKLLAAALILRRVDQGKEQLDRHVAIRQSDIISYSPAAEKRVGNDMTVAELCEAAVTLSDNAAANLLLASFGGPHAVTAFVRSLGDGTTRLDRNEPTLNESVPRDPRDTTSPTAMLGDIRKLVLGDVLSPQSKDQLTKWLTDTKTADKRLRAKLPPGWRTGGKTGTGAHGSTNDVGILWPPQGAPILVAAYLTQTSAPPEAREAALADIGRAIASTQFA